MKKWFYIVLVALVAVANGCTKVEETPAPGKKVSFQVGSYAPQTKAEGDPIALNSIGIEDFRCFAYLHGEGVETAQPFFGNSGETISYHAGTPVTWTPSHDYYWPKSAESYVNFISWHGVDPAIAYETNSDNKWSATLTWDLDVNVTPDADLLWADMAWRYNANVVPATYKTISGVEEGVPTLFHHALAQVRFLANVTKREDTGVQWSVTLNSLSLAGAKSTAIFSMTNVDPEATQTNAWTDTTWSSLSGSADIASTAALTNLALAPDTTEVIGYKSVIPQAVDGMELTVDFTVVTTYTGS
ncbi:MAG: fimbrillin family protein, partial [Bacteroidales bacterium]|nr:fimbrillin family protein [Bacteroidales bacterium]